jgi:CubicO group peptidase (beta-lactamase class C family)
MTIRPNIFGVTAIVCGFSALGCAENSGEPVATAPSALSQSLQAEDAVFAQAALETLHSGYTGNGYVNTDNVAGSYVEWRVTVPAGISATLGIRYALESGTRSAALRVNGALVSSSLSFASTGAWNSWGLKTANVSLSPNTNVIRLTCTSSMGCPNLDRLDVTYDDPRVAVDGFFTTPSLSTFLLRSGSLQAVSWRYTFTTPPSTWTQSSFGATGWASGSSGFGFGPGVVGDVVRTAWAESSPQIWARTTFSIASSADFPKLMFWGRWDDHLQVYVNGVLAFAEASTSRGYRFFGLTPAGRAALKTGTNTLAVRVTDTGGSKYFDLGVFRDQTLTTRPMSGFDNTPALAAYGETLRQFMVERGIPAGVLSVMKRDRVVVSRGVGWKDKARTTTISENAVMRLMSIDKSITHAAVRRIIDANTFDPVSGQTITPDTLVFPLLAAHGLTPPPGFSVDPLVNQITVGHLIAHQGGLFEPPAAQELYDAFDITGEQSNLHHNVRWVYAAGTWFVPGQCPNTGGCYSSSGYMVLRYLVHVLKGDLLGYLRNTVLAPVGTADVHLAAERLENRLPSEPGYFTFGAPVDRWINLENYTALSATAPALTRFARGYHIFQGNRLVDPLTGKWAAIPDNGGWVFGGLGEGATSFLLQRLWDEVNIAVIFNMDGEDFGTIVDRLAAVTDAMPESAWGP